MKVKIIEDSRFSGQIGYVININITESKLLVQLPEFYDEVELGIVNGGVYLNLNEVRILPSEEFGRFIVINFFKSDGNVIEACQVASHKLHQPFHNCIDSVGLYWKDSLTIKSDKTATQQNIAETSLTKLQRSKTSLKQV